MPKVFNVACSPTHWSPPVFHSRYHALHLRYVQSLLSPVSIMSKHCDAWHDQSTLMSGSYCCSWASFHRSSRPAVFALLPCRCALPVSLCVVLNRDLLTFSICLHTRELPVSVCVVGNHDLVSVQYLHPQMWTPCLCLVHIASFWVWPVGGSSATLLRWYCVTIEIRIYPDICQLFSGLTRLECQFI